ncbi:MAG: hypothetical protein C4529_06380 [Deltaproteobacteria bacterium]|nr:MAG: hypothetical protein C4529_06380 [Deltaproteobacteria bacterium]
MRRNLTLLRVDSVIVEKRKTHPALRDEVKFYPKMLGYLLRHLLKEDALTNGVEEVIVITDNIPVKSKAKAVEKTIKMTLTEMLPGTVKYRVLHHASKSSFGLQVADYCNWAIYRKWEGGDSRSYDLIRSRIRSEFDIFQSGDRYYY